MSPTSYNKNDLLSLAFGKAVAQKLRGDPSLLSVGIQNVKKWKSQGVGDSVYDEWLVIIGRGVDAVCQILTSEDEEGQRLRSSSVWPGILTQEERKEILNSPRLPPSLLTMKGVI